MTYYAARVVGKGANAPIDINQVLNTVVYTSPEKALWEISASCGYQYQAVELIKIDTTRSPNAQGKITVFAEDIAGIDYSCAGTSIALGPYEKHVDVIGGVPDSNAMRSVHEELNRRFESQEHYQWASRLADDSIQEKTADLLHNGGSHIDASRVMESLKMAYNTNSPIYENAVTENLATRVYNEALRQFAKSMSIESTRYFSEFADDLRTRLSEAEPKNYASEIQNATDAFVSKHIHDFYTHRTGGCWEETALRDYRNHASDIVSSAVAKHAAIALANPERLAEICDYHLNKSGIISYKQPADPGIGDDITPTALVGKTRAILQYPAMQLPSYVASPMAVYTALDPAAGAGPGRQEAFNTVQNQITYINNALQTVYNENPALAGNFEFNTQFINNLSAELATGRVVRESDFIRIAEITANGLAFESLKGGNKVAAFAYNDMANKFADSMEALNDAQSVDADDHGDIGEE